MDGESTGCILLAGGLLLATIAAGAIFGLAGAALVVAVFLIWLGVAFLENR